jgi:flagellum-specific peptidoglycan hydrolase FlgJ
MYGRFAFFVLLVLAMVMPGPVRAHYACSPNDISEEDILAYIDRYKDLAKREMCRSGIPASVKLAQAMLESNYGLSKLARQHNNHFGI